MSGESDDDWARAAAELAEKPTEASRSPALDEVLDVEISRPTPAEIAAEAVPDPVRDTTGKYKTLPGFEVARETVERVAFEKGRDVGRRQERRFLLMGFQLAQIESRTTPETACALAEMLERWVSRPNNARLINVACGWPEDGPKEDDR